jgi:hypothetical protein
MTESSTLIAMYFSSLTLKPSAQRELASVNPLMRALISSGVIFASQYVVGRYRGSICAGHRFSLTLTYHEARRQRPRVFSIVTEYGSLVHGARANKASRPKSVSPDHPRLCTTERGKTTYLVSMYAASQVSTPLRATLHAIWTAYLAKT